MSAAKQGGISAIWEERRLTRVAEAVDVIVCGGGPAGVSAAIQAARAGMRTRLIEVHGCLGGIWTSGLLSYVIDAEKPQGLLPEIVERLKQREAYRRRMGANFLYDPEQMKLVLEELCLEAGVAIQLHTRVVSAQVGGRRLESIITESKSGRQAWRANVYIDCTGDGDLGALAGCRYDLGDGESHAVQPMSLMALVSGVDPETARPYHDVKNLDRKANLLEVLRRGGCEPSYGAPTLFHIRDDLYALMVNHEYLISPDNAQQITDATLRARQEIDLAVRALRSVGGIWRELRLLTSATQIGVREGRRICGRETLTADDLATGRRREDSTCRATFSMDVHSPNPGVSKAFDFRHRRPVLPYDIPYGAMVAADVDGLLMAGRCISGDFLAHSSYRVTGNAVAMGESAGRAAALCVGQGLLPHELDWTLYANGVAI